MLPRRRRSRGRLVVLVHGGSWGGGFTKVVMGLLAADLVRRGHPVWNVEYRRVGHDGGGWPQTGQDVVAALRHTHELPVGTDGGIVVLGHSAGAQLAARAASEPGLGVELALLVLMAGPLSLTAGQRRHPGPSAISRLVGGEPDLLPAAYLDADPIAHVPPPAPVLLVHGTDDHTVSVRHSRAYLAACLSAGGTADLVEIPGRAGVHRAHVTPWGATWRPVTERLGALGPTPAAAG